MEGVFLLLDICASDILGGGFVVRDFWLDILSPNRNDLTIVLKIRYRQGNSCHQYKNLEAVNLFLTAQ